MAWILYYAYLFTTGHRRKLFHAWWTVIMGRKSHKWQWHCGFDRKLLICVVRRMLLITCRSLLLWSYLSCEYWCPLNSQFNCCSLNPTVVCIYSEMNMKCHSQPITFILLIYFNWNVSKWNGFLNKKKLQDLILSIINVLDGESCLYFICNNNTKNTLLPLKGHGERKNIWCNVCLFS